MNERISELIDGELADAEAMRHIAALKDDGALRRTWDTYHLIGDAIRGHMATDLTAKVAARLRDEPTVLAPRHAPDLPQIRRWSYSAAAAAAAIAVVAWVAPPMLSSEQPELAQIPATQSAPLPATAEAADVENYLLAHQRFTGMAPAVRPVAHQTREPQRPEARR